MTNPNGWGNASVDPTAGVTLMPKRILCPRCGIDKGQIRNARKGLCGDCVYLIRRDPEAREAWGVGLGGVKKTEAA